MTFHLNYQDFLKHSIDFWPLDLSVTWDIIFTDKQIDLSLNDLSVCVNVLPVIDEAEDFLGIETVAVVSVVLFEVFVNQISEFLSVYDFLNSYEINKN